MYDPTQAALTLTRRAAARLFGPTVAEHITQPPNELVNALTEAYLAGLADYRPHFTNDDTIVDGSNT